MSEVKRNQLRLAGMIEMLLPDGRVFRGLGVSVF